MWQNKLLQWYQRHRRDLPWRRSKDPYAIWVSEIMLQQTTVETVIPYYEKFLRRFPTVQKLAAASEEEVLRYWSGLGYYLRARNLHKAAKQIVGNVGARRAVPLPHTVEELMQLPGIGRYTAGAIASIAFNQPAPILDGNVVRVLSRLFKIGRDPKTTEGQKYFWEVSEAIVDLHRKQGLASISAGTPRPLSARQDRGPLYGGSPQSCKCGQQLAASNRSSKSAQPPVSGEFNYGNFNQAMMELGATVCTPEAPKCRVCPIREDCQAQKVGQPEKYPRIQKKTRYVDVTMTAALVQRGDQILIVQRPAHGLMKSMWEFPTVEGTEMELQKAWSVELVRPLATVRHAILNRRLSIRPWMCRLQRAKRQGGVWIYPHELTQYPTSSMNRKILQKYLLIVR